MTGLFDLSWRRALPLNQIEGIDYDEDQATSGRAHRIKLAGDDFWHVLTDVAHQALVSRPMQLIPLAQPTELASWDLDHAQPEIWFEPLIAWALCFDGQVRPVTAGGVNGGVSEPIGGNFVRLPDGRIQGVGPYSDVGSLDDADALLAHLLDQRRIVAEHRASAAATKLVEGGDA